MTQFIREMAENAQAALVEAITNLPREGVDRNTVDTIARQVARESTVRPKRGRQLVKEATDQTVGKVLKLKRGAAVDRSEIDEL